MSSVTTAEATPGWIVQHQEDDPTSPGWWRFSRPYWVAGPKPPSEGHYRFPDSIRWTWGTLARLEEDQAKWDRNNLPAKKPAPTVGQVLMHTAIGNGLHRWAVEGGSIRLSYEQLRPLLEEAYDPGMPNWVALVNVDDLAAQEQASD